MNSKITLTLYLLFSFHYAAMQDLESPQGGRGLPGAHVQDHHDHSLVIKLLAVVIVLLITLIILLIMHIIISHKKMEMLIIQINKQLAEEKVSLPSIIMKHEETQTEDLIMY